MKPGAKYADSACHDFNDFNPANKLSINTPTSQKSIVYTVYTFCSLLSQTTAAAIPPNSTS